MVNSLTICSAYISFTWLSVKNSNSLAFKKVITVPLLIKNILSNFWHVSLKVFCHTVIEVELVVRIAAGLASV